MVRGETIPQSLMCRTLVSQLVVMVIWEMGTSEERGLTGRSKVLGLCSCPAHLLCIHSAAYSSFHTLVPEAEAQGQATMNHNKSAPLNCLPQYFGHRNKKAN